MNRTRYLHTIDTQDGRVTLRLDLEQASRRTLATVALYVAGTSLAVLNDDKWQRHIDTFIAKAMMGLYLDNEPAHVMTIGNASAFRCHPDQIFIDTSVWGRINT